jgi:hypothetical protein
MDRPVEGGYRSAFSSHCGDRRSFFVLNVCSANILVLTGLQHQYIVAVQGEQNCLQHHAYSVKRCLFNQLE